MQDPAGDFTEITAEASPVALRPPAAKERSPAMWRSPLGGTPARLKPIVKVAPEPSEVAPSAPPAPETAQQAAAPAP